LLNLRPGGGPLTFALPRVALEIEFRIKDRPPVMFTPHLDTVLVDLWGVSAGRPVAIEMVWRAHVRAPRRLKDARVLIRERGLS
jgi:hypothetical protein